MSSNPTSPQMVYQQTLNVWEKAVTWGAYALAGAVFLTIGWIAMQPLDPQGAVSLLACRNPLGVLIEAVALAAVTGALATAVAGRYRPDIGTFAVAVGLAALSLRGGTTATLLVENADRSGSFQRGLALKMFLESAGWFLVMVVSFFASSLVVRWLGGPSDSSSGSDATPTARDDWLLCVQDIPGVPPGFSGLQDGGIQTQPSAGLLHALITAGVAWVAIALIFAGLSSRSIVHGQACSLVAIAVWIGTFTAHRFAPVRSVLWPVLGVMLLAAVGYLWSGIRPMASSLPLHFPHSNFLRVLPLQFITVGTAAAIATFWGLCARVVSDSEDVSRSARGRTVAEKRRGHRTRR